MPLPSDVRARQGPMTDTPSTSARILLIEDDEDDYEFTRELLADLPGAHLELSWVSDYHKGIEASRTGRFDVCLVDYRLGAESGIDLLRELVANGHPMPVILLTGHDDRDVDLRASLAGAADFLVKGEVSAALLERTIRYAIRAHAAARALRDSYRTTVRVLAPALELRDDQTGAHAERVTELALLRTERIAPDLRADPELEFGFLLHDIGKIGVPDALVLKPGSLTPEEMDRMRRHVDLGEQIIADVPFLGGLARDVVTAHHERFDGAGYPSGLRGEEIPLVARIFAVVDAFDAMTNDRPYRRAASPESALVEIQSLAGSQFDPLVVDAFVALIAEQTAQLVRAA
jgi:response regulator RpfG family c-di-GMP phosphodiesterase